MEPHGNNQVPYKLIKLEALAAGYRGVRPTGANHRAYLRQSRRPPPVSLRGGWSGSVVLRKNPFGAKSATLTRLCTRDSGNLPPRLST